MVPLAMLMTRTMTLAEHVPAHAAFSTTGQACNGASQTVAPILSLYPAAEETQGVEALKQWHQGIASPRS